MRKIIFGIFAFALVAIIAPASAEAACVSTGVSGLEANYVNEVPDSAFDVTCDIGIFIDEDMTIDGAEVNGTTADAKSVQFGVYVYEADVVIKNSIINVEIGYPNQFVSATYRNGATGSIKDNVFTGPHRVAVALRGVNTDVEVSKNLIEGTGAKTTGWAENGIQIDQSATGQVVGNTIIGHWWDGPSNWASSGLLVYSDSVSIVNNRFEDNEFSIFLVGNNNKVNGNNTSSQIVSQSDLHFMAYGVLIAGSNNHIAGNYLSSLEDFGLVGIYIYSGSEKNRITGNRISGFEYPVYDGGSDTLEKGNPSKFN